MRSTVARQGRHADQRVSAVSRHRNAGGRSVRHPVLVRIGEGDFYEDSAIRFAPNIQVSRMANWAGVSWTTTS